MLVVGFSFVKKKLSPLLGLSFRKPVIVGCVADPGPGIRCLFVPWIRDARWVKNLDLDLGSVSGMNNPDHISEILDTIFWVKILKFFHADGKNSDPGSGINIRIPNTGSRWRGLPLFREKILLLSVVGFAFLVPDTGWNECYLSYCLTHPDWQAAGIGITTELYK